MAKAQDTLICRDTKGKIRRVDISLSWSDDLHAYVIERSSGLLDGKQVIAPVIEIHRGKASRTVTEPLTDLTFFPSPSVFCSPP